MFLQQYPCAQSSLAYLFGCVGQGLAIAVDVHSGDEERFLALAEDQGVQIRYVIDTHIHADHLSGGRRLAEQAGAAYALHESNAGLPFDFLPLADGAVLHAGNVSVQVVHTPGHTDDHISLLVADHSRSDEPWFLLTGHALFPGGVGRPDLHGREREMAAKLYDSLFDRLLTYPDHIEILAGAQAGSVCGGGISGKPCSTIGYERRHNPQLRLSRAAFIEEVSQTVLPDVAGMRAILAANTAA
jgi:hydroxyacylglutathione hydrolase